MSSAQVELVLPLKPSNEERGSDWRRVKNGLLPSLEAFCDRDFVRCLSIIVPSSGRNAAEELAKDSKLPVSVVIEDDLLPMESLRGLPRSGWYIQQMLKMHFAKICQTTWYLTLDADIVLTRPIDSRIVEDGRFPIQYEPASAHPGWWRVSSKLLRSVTPVAPDDKRVFGVTPGFIKSAVMRRTLDRLDFVARDHKQDWVSHLAKNTNLSDDTWTEYSLYWSVLTWH